MSRHNYGSDPPGLRWCSVCKFYLPIEDFSKNRSRKDGLASGCGACSTARDAKWTAKFGSYSRHVHNAVGRGLEPLPRAEFHTIIWLPCVFGGGCRPEILVGVDRIDSGRGYHGNSQPCCPFHNYIKGTFEDDLLRIHIERHPELQACQNGGMSAVATRLTGGRISEVAVPPIKPKRLERRLPLFESGPAGRLQ
jgi:hypothetical protein